MVGGKKGSANEEKPSAEVVETSQFRQETMEKIQLFHNFTVAVKFLSFKKCSRQHNYIFLDNAEVKKRKKSYSLTRKYGIEGKSTFYNTLH